MVFLGDKGFTFSTSRRVQVRKPGSMRGPSKASPLGFREHPGHPQGAPWSLRSLGAPGAPKGPLGVPLGTLGPEALRAGGLGKHGLTITRSALGRHGLNKGGGLAVPGEAVSG